MMEKSLLKKTFDDFLVLKKNEKVQSSYSKKCSLNELVEILKKLFPEKKAYSIDEIESVTKEEALINFCATKITPIHVTSQK